MVLDTDTPCSHPRCDVVVTAGDSVFPARLREGDFYCSPECRGRDTRRKIQNRRRESPGQVEYERRLKLERKYGVSAEDWGGLYDRQLGRCAICLTPLSETKVHVDHDHSTGAVRGLLCSTCNPGLGFFKDDPAVLLRAAEYLIEQGSLASAQELEKWKEVTDSVD